MNDMETRMKEARRKGFSTEEARAKGYSSAWQMLKVENPEEYQRILEENRIRVAKNKAHKPKVIKKARLPKGVRPDPKSPKDLRKMMGRLRAYRIYYTKKGDTAVLELINTKLRKLKSMLWMKDHNFAELKAKKVAVTPEVKPVIKPVTATTKRRGPITVGNVIVPMRKVFTDLDLMTKSIDSEIIDGWQLISITKKRCGFLWLKTKYLVEFVKDSGVKRQYTWMDVVRSV